MGMRVGIAGSQNTGKSYGRRYIWDGENVMIIQPSVKTPHLFQSIPGTKTIPSPEEIDKLIATGKRKVVKRFDVVSPEGKYTGVQDALERLAPQGMPKTLHAWLSGIDEKKKPGYFGKTNDEARKYLTGNIILCEKLEQLQFFIFFVNKWMPWIHTIILPDFTHFISEKITSQEFINRKIGGEQYAKYLDLAAEALRSFITASDKLREDLVVVTEYHVEWLPDLGEYEVFLPGGKMIKEKFLPTSYYDTFLFTDCKYPENEENEEVEYRYVTRKTRKYPEARTIGGFEDLYIPNNLQEVLTKLREYNGIEL
jgi:hypothetical protein